MFDTQMGLQEKIHLVGIAQFGDVGVGSLKHNGSGGGRGKWGRGWAPYLW